MSARPRLGQAKRNHCRYMYYYMQQRADRLKDAGLCVICGTKPARDGLLTCQRCIDKQIAARKRGKK